MKPLDRANWIPILVIAGLFSAAWVAVGAWRDVPVMDDWVYAWSVEHLLAARELRVVEFSAIYPITQILWAAPFAWVAGFSFAALRASTVVLSATGCYALYLTARELGWRPATSLLVALTLALDPAYFALSFSFMTDVPFVSLSNVAIYFVVSATRRGSIRRLWIAAAVSVAAFLIRPIAIALPVAAMAALPWRTPIRRRAEWIGPSAAALATMAVAWIVITRAIGTLDVAANRLQQLQWWFLVPAAKYADWNVHTVFEATFPVAPLALAAIRRRSVVPVAAVAIAIAIACALTLGSVPSPLPHWQTWSLQEISTRTMLGCDLGPSTWSLRAAPWLEALGTVVVAAFVVAAVRRDGDSREGRGSSAEAGRAIVVVALAQLAFVNLLWLYNDRYYLVFAPWLALLALRLGRPRPAAVLPLLAVWAFFAVTGTRDMLALNGAVADAALSLERAGVAAADIDAGYVSDGWRLYDHPDRLPPGADRRYDVPFVTSDADTPYRIANCPMPGYTVVQVVPLPSASWQTTNRIYVLKREPSLAINRRP